MKRKAAKGGTNSDTNSDFYTDEEDDTFFQQYLATQMAKMKLKTRTIDEVVIDFLSKTNIPYVIIGGKASSYYIGKMNYQNSDNTRLAVSTNDYDIMIPLSFKDTFINEIFKEVDSNTMSKLELKENSELNIYMLGWMEGGMFRSVIDVHCISHKLPSYEVSEQNVKYVNKKWLCDELLFTIKNRSSEGEMLKYLKREARSKLLRCHDSTQNVVTNGGKRKNK